MNKMPLVQQKLRGFSTVNNIFYIERNSLFIETTQRCRPAVVMEEGNSTQEWCWHRCGQHPYGCWMGRDSVRVKSDTHSLFGGAKEGTK